MPEHKRLWHSEGRLTRDGFVVVMSIPFRSLHFPDAPSQTWGLALLRIVARKNARVLAPDDGCALCTHVCPTPCS